jgi:hypothetical protein
MTKTIVLGASYQTIQKPIEFLMHMNHNFEFKNDVNGYDPSQAKYIELICKRYNGNLDLMFTYSDPSKRGEGLLYIGYWNDGVVK